MLVPVLLASLLVPAASARDASFPEAVTGLAQQIAEKTPKKSRLLISNIYDRDGRLTYFGRHLSEKLQAALAGRPEFVVVARQRLDLILDEMRLQQTGLMDPHTVAKTGKMLGADIIVYGTVLDLEKSIDIDLTVQAIESSAIIGTATQRLKKTDELASLLRSIIDSERKHNEEDLAFAAPQGSTDSAKVDALKRDNRELGEVLKTGLWRGGPTFEHAALGFLTRFAADGPLKPAGLWLNGGLAVARYSHGTLGLNYYLTPAFGVELEGGFFSNHDRQIRPSGTLLPHFLDRTYAASYLTFKGTYSLRFERLPIASAIRFPWTLSLSAGPTFTRVHETGSDNYSVAGTAFYTSGDLDNVFYKVDPTFGVAIAHYIQNFAAVRVAFDYVVSKTHYEFFHYAGPRWTIQFVYRVL